jgi:hypothetical protein
MQEADAIWQSWPVTFLGLVIWREARGESEECRIAVGCCVRERVFNEVRFDGTDFVSACKAKWQFSSVTAPGDPQLTFWPADGLESFRQCVAIANRVINNMAEHPAPGADSYFDDSIKDHPPSWATPDRFVRKINRLNFYRVNS